MSDIVNLFQRLWNKDTEAAYKFALDTGLKDADAAFDLAHWLLINPVNNKNILADLLSYISIDQFKILIDLAIAVLQTNSLNEAATEILEKASLQVVTGLHPYLQTVFQLNLQNQSIYSIYPWRDSQDLYVDYLQDKVLNTHVDMAERRFAWDCLIEKRTPESLAFVKTHAAALERNFPLYLEYIGFKETGQYFEALYQPNPRHILFSSEYCTRPHRPFWLQQNHPTWRLPVHTPMYYRFGGNCSGQCNICGQDLHHIITFDPIPDVLAIKSLTALTIATCLSCLGWNYEVADRLYYSHDSQGLPKHIGYHGTQFLPEVTHLPLMETTIQLSEINPRWKWQSWGIANSRENLHRVGGYPCWIQDSEHPSCIQCQAKMSFIMQLDSNILSSNGGEWGWGVYGICYIFWCDVCRISALFWQCT